MDLLKTIVVVFCSVFGCEYEYPSDPLNMDAGSIGISERSGRAQNQKLFPIHIPKLNELIDAYSPLIVSTNAGKVEGYKMKTIKGKKFNAFEGIPYGEDTGGKNRFKLPIPKSKWNGILKAKKVGPKCLQMHLLHALRIVGSEDCLYLNVYTPNLPKQGKMHPNLPVLLFIHGGSWYFGSGSEYGPAYFLEHPIILVTINYRLGIFGFLSTGDRALPGNLGLKDQALAIDWVSKNIRNFGGNPQNITLMGQSAGAASTHLHMMSKLSRGKFARAISVSGSAFGSWTLMNSKHREHQNAKIAIGTICPRNPSDAFVECLRRKTARELVRLTTVLYIRYPLLPAVPLGSVIEDPNDPNAFLTAHPDELYAKNEVAAIPFLCGRNGNETEAMFTVLGVFRLTQENALTQQLWYSLAPVFMDYRFSSKNSLEITTKSRDFYKYLNFTHPNTFPTTKDLYSEMTSDRIFNYGIHKSVQLHSQIAPTFSWIYSYKGRSSLVAQFGEDPKKFGVTHTDDLPIYFNMSEYYPGYKTTSPEYKAVHLMTNLFANFVSNGEPLYQKKSNEIVQIWKQVKDPKNIKVLSIGDNTVKMIDEPNTERYKFWESLNLDDMKPFLRK